MHRARSEKHFEFLRRHGRRKQEALEIVAADLAEEGTLLRSFDALGRGFEANGLGEIDDRLHQSVAGRRATDFMDERSVDFDPVDLKVRQVPER